MTAIDNRTNTHAPDDAGRTEEFVELDELVWNGCGSCVRPESPVGWPASAGAAPEFSHSDGSVLCPDEHGRLGEPFEIRTLASDRYDLTDSGRAVLVALEARS